MVVDGVTEGVEGVEKRQTLPLRLACAFIGHNKQKKDLASGICPFIEKANANEFYVEREILDPDTAGILPPTLLDTPYIKS